MKKIHSSNIQMSEAFINNMFLAFSGGLQDAYTYNTRDEVFSNAQTGNVVLMSQHIMSGEWIAALHYLFPLIAFILGVMAAEQIRGRVREGRKLHWRQDVLFHEIVILFIVGFLPSNLNIVATFLVSFACAMQVQTFRKVNGYAFASTMCIGNIRSGMESLCVYGKTKDKEKLYKAGHYLGIIGMFAVGAAVGGHLILLLHERTIWVSCGLLFVGFLLMFIKEELEEHPQILEEEQEIRKNIQNIREEAKEVENIIKDDLKK